MSDPIEVTATTPGAITATATGTSVSVNVGGGFGPQGPTGPAGPAGPVSSVQGLTGAVTLAVVGGTVSVAGSTITLAVTAAAVDWSSITGKPATFAPSAHSHAIADVTGLQAAIDAKQPSGSYAAASHTHTAASVTDFSAAALTAVTWSTITGKPATFTPATHSHVIADVTGLQAALDSKQASGSYAAASHTHTASAITDFTTAVVAAAPPTTDASLLTSGTLAAARLPATAVTAGSYGSASSVATFTVDAAGRLTAAGTAAISIAAGAVSGLAAVATAGTFASLTSKPTTVSGYGITDAAASSHTHAASDITSGVIAAARLASSGTASASTFLRGDGAWAAAGSTNASDLTTGTLAYARMADATVTTPAQITSNQNNYVGFARGINRFTTDAARDLTGMVAGNDGEVRLMVNVGSFALTLKHQSASSTAANRFTVPWSGDCVISASGGSAAIVYDATSGTWRVL